MSRIDPGQLLGRGISFPPRVGPDGRMVWSEGEANVRESVRVILMTEPRERIAMPTFGAGLGAYLFEPNTVTTRHSIQDRITRALAEWEPRIAVESVAVEPDEGDPTSAVATVTYRLVATATRERVRLNVTLGT
jgi:uncharacterized protein